MNNSITLNLSKSPKLFQRILSVMSLCVILFLGMGSLKAQTQGRGDTVFVRTAPQIRFELGMAAGFTTGVGTAGRMVLGKVGVQGTFAAFTNQVQENYYTGWTLLYNLRQWNTGNLYLYQGNFFMSNNRYERYTYGLKNGKPVVDEKFTIRNRNWNHGLGIGYELFQGPGKYNPFGFNLMMGFGAFKNFTQSFFTGEVAVLYKFGKVKSTEWGKGKN